jgi:hypothetical protein
MRRAALAACGIGCLVLLLALASVARAAQAGTPASTEEPLAFDIEFHDTILAADSTQLSLGDRFILSDRLLANGTEVGHTSGLCTITDAAGEAICNVVFALPGGTIAAQFVNAPPPEKVFAIIGGTGRYQGARGTGELVEAPDQTGTLAFHLLD